MSVRHPVETIDLPDHAWQNFTLQHITLIVTLGITASFLKKMAQG